MKAIFFDRDGVICKKLALNQYVLKESELEFSEGVTEFLKLFWLNDFLRFIITNQSCIAKGLLTFEELSKINKKIRDELVLGQDISLIIRVCPHDDKDNCECRKPKPGLILEAMTDYRLKPEDCWVIGDSDRDIQAGIAAGIPTVQCLLISYGCPETFAQIKETILGPS